MPLAAQTPDPLVLVGKGYDADVYAWGDGCVLKLYYNHVSRVRVEHEYTVARAIHATGLRVPAVYELVEREGRYGIVFERIDGVSLLSFVQARPWILFETIQQVAELHARIHTCIAPAELPSLRQRIADRIAAAPDLSDEDRRRARTCLADLPDGTALCHGDFHPGNVLVTPSGPVVIDWSAATRGHPLGDVACTSRLLRTAQLPPWAPGYAHLLLRCLRPVMHRSYLKHYFRRNRGTRRQIEAWQVPLAAAARIQRVPQ
jgi:uncharacterized protein (TIGR02172 family)